MLPIGLTDWQHASLSVNPYVWNLNKRCLSGRAFMLVRTPVDFGALMLGRSKQLTLNQATLAKRIGVSSRG
jgi:hypothetical protein